jgi:hypothetical protein
MESTSSAIISLLGLVGLPAIIAAGVGIFIARVSRDLVTEKVKASIKAEYDERLETIKAQLKASSDIELEKNKHELQLSANLRSLQYGKLLEKRADVIARVYAEIMALFEITTIYDNQIKNSQEDDLCIERLSEALKSARTNYEPNRIYFAVDTSYRLSHMFFSVGRAVVTFNRARGSDSEKSLQPFHDLINSMNSIQGALSDLEAEFRELIGVEARDLTNIKE